MGRGLGRRRMKRMGRSQRALDWNAAHFGEPRGMESDLFFATWKAVRERFIELPEGAEKDEYGEMLGAMQDYFDERQG